MNNVQIQIVCAKPLQTAFDFPVDCFGRKPSGVKIDFGSDDNFVS